MSRPSGPRPAGALRALVAAAAVALLLAACGDDGDGGAATTTAAPTTAAPTTEATTGTTAAAPAGDACQPVLIASFAPDADPASVESALESVRAVDGVVEAEQRDPDDAAAFAVDLLPGSISSIDPALVPVQVAVVLDDASQVVAAEQALRPVGAALPATTALTGDLLGPDGEPAATIDGPDGRRLCTAEGDTEAPVPTDDRCRHDVIVYLEPGADEATLDALADEVASLDGVAEVTVADQDQAFEEFTELFGDDPELAGSVTADQLPASVRVDLAEPGAEAAPDVVAAVDAAVGARSEVRVVVPRPAACP